MKIEEALLLAAKAISVVRLEPTMSGSVLGSFDRTKFIKAVYEYYAYLEKHNIVYDPRDNKFYGIEPSNCCGGVCGCSGLQEGEAGQEER